MERYEVIRLYELLLRRLPENEVVITTHMHQCQSPTDLVEIILNSPEWKAKHTQNDLTDYSGINGIDVELLSRYARPSAPEPGFFKDFLGSRTAIGYVHTTADKSGIVESLPIPNSIHSEAIEWVGALRAVDEATDKFVAVELGAGWGPWVVSSSVAAQGKGIKNINLIAVEADLGKIKFISQHFRDNGFDPEDHRILHGIVGPRDGFAYFPEIDSQADWGGEAIFAEATNETEQSSFLFRGCNAKHNKLRSYSLATIIGDLTVDFCHFDIQGAEFVVLSAARVIAKAKIRRLVIGTHSRMVEAQLFDLLASDDWVLENEKPCKFRVDANGEAITTLDGTQIWRNSSIG